MQCLDIEGELAPLAFTNTILHTVSITATHILALLNMHSASTYPLGVTLVVIAHFYWHGIKLKTIDFYWYLK